MAYTDYSPSADCATVLPEVSSDFCNPTLQLSELTDLYICDKSGKNFTDVTSPTEWASRLNDAGTVPTGATGIVVADVIRHLPITGEYPKPAVTEKDISGGREKFPLRSTHTINFTIDDITDANYKLAQFTQKGARYVKAWVKTKGNKLIGGNKGLGGSSVVPARLRIDPVFAKGSEVVIELQGTITWFGVGIITPDLTTSPI